MVIRSLLIIIMKFTSTIVSRAKALFSIILIGSAFTLPLSATVIFTETFGSVSGTTTLTSLESSDGFDNDSLTFSGTGDVRLSTASSTTYYSTASGTSNVYLAATKTLIISGVDTSAFEAGTIELSFGAYKNTTASSMSELTLEWSVTGTDTWTTITLTAQATGSGTAVWRYITLSDTGIGVDDDISIRFTNTSSSIQFRLDDLTLSGTAAVPETASSVFAFGFVSLGVCLVARRKRRD